MVIQKRGRLAALGAGAAMAGVLLAGCGHSPAKDAAAEASARARASAAASAFKNNKQAQGDEAKAEALLLGCAKKQHHLLHFVKYTVECAFPQGDSTKIEDYAKQTFTLSVIHTKGPGSARDKWVQGVAQYALNSGTKP